MIEVDWLALLACFTFSILIPKKHSATALGSIPEHKDPSTINLILIPFLCRIRDITMAMVQTLLEFISTVTFFGTVLNFLA